MHRRHAVLLGATVLALGSSVLSTTQVSAETAPSSSTTYDVVLMAAGTTKIYVIREIVALTGLSLTDATALANSLPAKVLKNVSSEVAQAARERLVHQGATVDLHTPAPVAPTVTADAGAAADSGAPTAPTATREPLRYDLTLYTVGPNRIAVIKEVRETLASTVAEAEAIVNRVPYVLRRSISRAYADAVKARFESIGATIELATPGRIALREKTRTTPAPAPSPTPSGAAPSTAFDVILVTIGTNRILVLKALRSFLTADAAEAVLASPPRPVKTNVGTAEAESIRRILVDAGATIELVGR